MIHKKCINSYPYIRIKVDTQNYLQIHKIASSSDRVKAFIIDNLFYLLPTYILSGLAISSFLSIYSNFSTIKAIVFVLLAIAYSIFVLSVNIKYMKKGTTFCKDKVNLIVIDAKSKKPVDLGQHIFRETIGKGVSIIILGIGYLMVFFDSKHRGLHDKVAGTLVVKKQ